jgi:hypothetical protein
MEQKESITFTESASDIRKPMGAVNITLFGGMDRLKKHYIDEAEKCGVNVKVLNNARVNISAQIQNADAVVIFTNKVSHLTKKEVMNVARSRQIKVLMCHSCGICSWRECIGCLINESLSSAGL